MKAISSVGCGNKTILKGKVVNVFRIPDNIGNAKQELQRHIGKLGQLHIAEKVGQAMTSDSICENKSYSFQIFLQTLLHHAD